MTDSGIVLPDGGSATQAMLSANRQRAERIDSITVRETLSDGTVSGYTIQANPTVKLDEGEEARKRRCEERTNKARSGEWHRKDVYNQIIKQKITRRLTQ